MQHNFWKNCKNLSAGLSRFGLQIETRSLPACEEGRSEVEFRDCDAESNVWSIVRKAINKCEYFISYNILIIDRD